MNSGSHDLSTAHASERNTVSPKVLIVEPNPYHGEILPGFTHLFQKLGYGVDVLVRPEVLEDDPFVRYPEGMRPKVFSGNAQFIKETLRGKAIRMYDVVFVSSNVYWEKNVNISSLIRFLGFVPRGKYGSLYIEHNLAHLDDDDSRFFYGQGRVFTMLEYPFEGSKTKMINPHYFGQTPIRRRAQNKKRILVVGTSSREGGNLDYLYDSLRSLDATAREKLQVTIVGENVKIPTELRRAIKSLGRVDFDGYYGAIEDADYLLTIIDHNNPSQSKYAEGTTTGTVQSSLGFRKPLIIDELHAKAYGVDKTMAVIHKDKKLKEAFVEIAAMGDGYAKLVDSIAQKSKDVEAVSLENLRTVLSELHSRDQADIDVVDQASLRVARQETLLQKSATENRALKRQVRESDEQLSAVEYQLHKQSAKLGQLEMYAQPGQKNMEQAIDAVIRRAIPIEAISRRASRLGASTYRELNNRRANKSKDRQKLLVSESGFFDREYYLASYPDVARAQVDPLDHYLTHGYKEGRHPGPLFDQEYYVAKNVDINPAHTNPLIHYLLHGKQEGRMPNLGREPALEDARVPIAFQLESFDRGGLEEVVLMLASDTSMNKSYKVYIFVTGDDAGYLATVARERGIDIIALNHNLDYLELLIKRLGIQLCNLHYSVFGVNTYKQLGVKTVYTIHNNYIWANPEFVRQRQSPYKRVDSFIAVSDQVADYFSRRFSVDKSRITTVTNGINPAYIGEVVPARRTDYGVCEKDFLFIDVASFTPNKFHALLIASLGGVKKIYPGVKLLLVGNVIDGAYFKTIQDLIDKYGVRDNVKIVDFVPKQQVFGLLEMADCFVIPSLTEGFSIATLEAMYFRLPMILTDVGGARHVIEDNDIGIIVKNAYNDVQDLTDQLIEQRYVDDSNLDNKQDVVAAMLDMIKDKAAWKQRARKGRDKVMSSFQAEHVVESYGQQFSRALFGRSDFEDRLDLIVPQVETVFFAPYPTLARVTEGWMSRIKAIDRLIGNKGKIYVNVTFDDRRPTLEQHEEHGWEITIGRRSAYYGRTIDKLVDNVGGVYVHTLHLAEYVIPWLDSGKITVDFHGVTPEEEVMLGRSYLKEKYEDIEKRVLAKAATCVMVTNAMAKHYAAKYPDIKPKRLIILPIIENIKTYIKPAKKAGQKYEVVYSGGTQPWQNVDAMLELAKTCGENARFTFFSHDWQRVEDMGKSLEVDPDTIYEFCDKANLPKRYTTFDFGFVLRDDTAVNRVACPTKLYEYMKHGIIPIVRLPHMGDFEEFGYGYITETDFSAGRLPSTAKIQEIMKKNYRAVAAMEGVFEKGNRQLKRSF